MKKLLIILCLVWLPVTASVDPYRAEFNLECFLIRQPLTVENLELALNFYNVASPEVVLAQAILETGSFTSDLCVNHNNLFGMRYPKMRFTTAKYEVNYHAHFDNWIDCVKDLAYWQGYYRDRGRDLSDYLVFLSDVGYAKDPHYIKKVQNIMINY